MTLLKQQTIQERNQEIIKLRKEGISHRKIAKLYCISSTQVFRIVNGEK